MFFEKTAGALARLCETNKPLRDAWGLIRLSKDTVGDIIFHQSIKKAF